MAVIKIKQEKLREIFNSKLDYEFTKGGFLLIDKKLLITQQKSLWRIVGQLDWFPFYGIRSLLEAYKNNALEEYKQQQLSTKRKILAVPKPNIWKDKKEEESLKTFYAERAKKLDQKSRKNHV
jgi:hypothetical protein